MRIAITGSNGFIGSYLKKRLEFDHEIVEWDLKGDRNIKDFTIDRCEYVIHLAALAGVRASIEDPEKYWVTNVEYTKHIQNTCYHNHVPLLYASSSCIHNWWLSPYGTTKKVNEETAMPNQVGLRFTTTYGDRARDNMLIPKLLDGSIEYVTNHVRDFIHVEDVIDAIVLLMSKDIRLLKPVYDIGTGKGVIVSELAKLIGYNNLPITEGDPCESKDNTANIDNLLELGWKPKHRVEEYIL
jgi:UDP-glucuronate 4-epimerase